MDSNEIMAKAKEIRDAICQAMDEMATVADRADLAAPSKDFQYTHDRLRENTYDVLVAGEAKRGKSSFINALIGRDLLPTGSKVTTCQVFRLTHAQEDGRRLRFEDDSTQSISSDELIRYGSQVAIDENGEPTFGGKMLRWIEVETPARFLPDGMHILDTPGMGALHAAHAEITQRFVPLADAVVFVLDSNQPIVNSEIDFLEGILQSTPYVFFILTKIDKFDSHDQCEDSCRRNEEILFEKLGDRLHDKPKVWPISNTLLREAVDEKDEEYVKALLEESRFGELFQALQAFLYRVAGWARSAEASLEGKRYYLENRNILAGRAASLKREGGEQAASPLGQLQHDLATLRKNWGPRGKKRRSMEDAMNSLIRDAISQCNYTLQPNGKIHAEYKTRIDSIQKAAEGKSMVETLANDVQMSVLNFWNGISTTVIREFGDHLAEFRADIASPLYATQDPVTADAEEIAAQLENAIRSVATTSRDLAPRRTSLGAKIAYGLRKAVTKTVTWFLINPFSLLRDAQWTAEVFLDPDVAERKLNRTKSDLTAKVGEVLRTVHGQLMRDIDITSGVTTSELDRNLREIQAFFIRSLDQDLERRLQMYETEIQEEEQREEMEEADKRDRLAAVQQNLSAWDQLGARFQKLAKQLTDAQNEFLADKPVGSTSTSG